MSDTHPEETPRGRAMDQGRGESSDDDDKKKRNEKRDNRTDFQEQSLKESKGERKQQKVRSSSSDKPADVPVEGSPSTSAGQSSEELCVSAAVRRERQMSKDMKVKTTVWYTDLNKLKDNPIQSSKSGPPPPEPRDRSHITRLGGRSRSQEPGGRSLVTRLGGRSRSQEPGGRSRIQESGGRSRSQHPGGRLWSQQSGCVSQGGSHQVPADSGTDVPPFQEQLVRCLENDLNHRARRTLVITPNPSLPENQSRPPLPNLVRDPLPQQPSSSNLYCTDFTLPDSMSLPPFGESPNQPDGARFETPGEGASVASIDGAVAMVDDGSQSGQRVYYVSPEANVVGNNQPDSSDSADTPSTATTDSGLQRSCSSNVSMVVMVDDLAAFSDAASAESGLSASGSATQEDSSGALGSVDTD